MVGRLLPGLDLPQLHPGVQRRGPEHLYKQLRGHEMAAGGRCEIAAPGQQLQGPQVDLLVAPLGTFHGFPGFGEGRRVQDDKIVRGLSLGGQLRQQVEHIRHQKIHLLLQAVAPGVGSGHVDGGGGNVHRRHMLRPAQGSIQSEGAGVGEAV